MGKSFKRERSSYSENNNKYEFKRKKNKVREETLSEEFFNYKIHGFNKKNSD